MKNICNVSRRNKLNSKCVLVTPPPVVDSIVNTNVFKDSETMLYAEAVHEVASTSKLPVIDLHDEMTRYAQKNGGIASFLVEDGVHLSSKGNDFVSRLVYGKLMGFYPALRPRPNWFPQFGNLIQQLDREAGLERKY